MFPLMSSKRPDRSRHPAIERRGELRPDQILAHRFRWKFFGVRRDEVQRFLAGAAGELARMRDALARELLEQAALRKSLEGATRRLDELQKGLTATERELAAYHKPEPPAPRVLTPAGRAVVDAPGLVDPAPPARGDPRTGDRRGKVS